MSKKKPHEEHENLERWLVSYADFITLLFAFFTVLYALGQTEQAKIGEALASIQQAFLSGGGVFPLRGQPFNPVLKQPAGSKYPYNPKNEGMQPQSEKENLNKIRQKVQGLFEQNTGLSVNADDIEVTGSRKGFKVRLSERLLFPEGSAKLKKEHATFLYELGERLGKLNLPLQVEGHSDQAPNSSSDQNWRTSLERASNVVRFLVDAAKYPKDQISIAGFGDTRPIESNKYAEGRARNRRIELSVVVEEGDLKNLPF